MTISERCRLAKENAFQVACSSEDDKNRMLTLAAEALISQSSEILRANEEDLSKFSREEFLRDRLRLDKKRIDDMAKGLYQLRSIPCPVGEMIDAHTAENGLLIERVRVPFGVIGIVYEARPNVTADAIGLCIKSGNAVVLRGSKDAYVSNRAIVEAIKNALKANGYDAEFIQLLEDCSREGAVDFMRQSAFLDLLIPRGGAALIRSTLENATVPVIETGTGNCHIYLENHADPAKALAIVINAKTQRSSVCNAAESLVSDFGFAEEHLQEIATELSRRGVMLVGDERACSLCNFITPAEAGDFSREFLSLKLSVKIADGIGEAIEFINKHSTHHSEAIVTEDREAAERFLREIDSACVYVNASTRFTDGFEFGFGAEMGISTQKLHARGPMGLRELTTYKYLIRGNGQIRR